MENITSWEIMETSALEMKKKMSVNGNMVKEEKKILESNTGHDHHDQNNMEGVERQVKEEGMNSKPSSPNGKDIAMAKQVPLVNIVDSSMEIDAKNHHAPADHDNEEDQIKSARAEMEEVKEENERLKSLLGQLVKDYQSLHMHFLEVLQKEADHKKSTDTVPITDDQDEEPELVSLSLGRRSSSEQRKESAKKDSNSSADRDKKEDQDESLNERLKLGLDCRFDQGDHNSTDEAAKNNSSFDNSTEEAKEEEPIETWPPSKTLKTARSADHDDDVLQQSHLKKARVSIRARCETPTMNDGCQWRKYGQKIAKGNPCPRAYYRCTISPTCPVRKQVQRCADDMSILITTYEGNHNHPLPVSATAMASTTSAAASMLNSRSSSSQPGLGTSTSANLHGLNFTLPHNSSSTSSSSSRSSPQHLYFPHSSITTNNSHPTITLDLTAPTTFNNFNRFSSTLPRPSPSCLSFSSSSSEAFHQTPWSHNGYYSNYSNYNKSSNIIGSSLNMGIMRQPINNNNPLPQEHFYQPYGASSNQNPSLTETIAAATKAITSNPNFRSALTAALTSYVGSGGQENHGGALPPASGFPFAQNGSVNKSSSSLSETIHLHLQQQQQQQQQQRIQQLQQQQGSLVLFPGSGRQISGSKSGSGSPPGGDVK